MKGRLRNILLWAVVAALNGLFSPVMESGLPWNTALGQESPADADTRPEIIGIELDESGKMVITVEVPAGIRKVVLEGRSQFGHGTWIPRGVRHLSGAEASTVSFQLDPDRSLEMLRVRALQEDPLPQSFYNGQKSFDGTVTDENVVAGPDVAFDADRAEGGAGAPGEENREVQESDIWAFRGDTLYFFNRLDGLQVIDVSTPSEPVVKKRYFLPAAGEQMYVVDDNHVALLVQDNCRYYGEDAGSKVIVIDVGADEPSVTGTIGIPGNIQETRLVGHVLYTSSSQYIQTTDEEGGSVWRQISSVVSIDLSNPAAPERVGEKSFSGWADAVYATDRFFFVATRRSWPFTDSEVHVVDISDPDGTLVERYSIPVKGWIKDKFKIYLDGDVLSLISEVRGSNGRLMHTRLLNYSLTAPERPGFLGDVIVGRNETLFATRFDGDRVYIVTFEQIDPLWVVDNSNPRQPEILGELEIPGWSTYIHPMGDRLITMGIDNIDGWRPAVQLFDVSDPATPTLLSKVLLGEEWGWSEANSDEKAFRVLPDQGMVLVPFSAWSNRQQQSGIQIIDFNADELTLRGVIDHDFTPRRATAHNDLIYSISNTELVTVDPADRDNPEVLSEIILSRQADRVLEFDSYLLTAETYWQSTSQTGVSLYSRDDLDTPLDDITFEAPADLEGSPQNCSFSSWFTHGDHIFVLVSSESLESKPAGDGEPRSGNPDFFSWLSVYSLSVDQSAGELSIVSAEHFRINDMGWNPLLVPTVFANGDVVLTRKPGYSWYFFEDVLWGGPGRPWGWSLSPLFLSMNVADPGQIRFLGEFTVESPADPELGGWVDYSEIFWVNREAFFSTQVSKQVELSPDPGTGTPPVPDKAPRFVWVTSNELTKVDFEDISTPTLHDPVDLPGRLIALTHGGNVLYTTGYAYEEDGSPNLEQQAIHASAYDEIQVSLIDTYETSNIPYEVAVAGNAVIYPDWESEKGYRLNAITLSGEGTIDMASQLPRENWISQIRSADGLVFVSTGYGGGVEALDYSSPESPEKVATWTVPGCLYPDISHMDGSAESGFFIPLGMYGVGFISMNTEP